MAESRVPVVVVAGFLGSGKTTLLNHLLRRSRGTRIGAVVNDFGSIEIDAMTVAGQVDSMVSLGNGCLCCAVDTSDLDEVLESLARPELGMDLIVVEASGLAEPETMIRMILASGNRRVVYGGLVEVVDAAEFTAVRERHPELARHLGVADLVVLNKADRVSEETRRELEDTVAELAPGVPVIPASHGRIDPALLFDAPHRERPAVEQLSFDSLLWDEREREETCAERSGEACGHGPGSPCARHLHAAYQSVAFTAADPLAPRRLLALLDARPAGLYRVKGFVDFGDLDPDHRYALHAVGGFLRFTPEPWPRDEPRGTQLVLIGTGLDGPALSGALAECVAAPTDGGPAAVDGSELWGVLRYVEREEEDAAWGAGAAGYAGDVADADRYEPLVTAGDPEGD
ncbi:GTP-binding protein [Streptomyces sp. AJS327]|uniref:CobW family GTP-binding protein n=1 Tax=Streptomyces sp. AJS327 TaxID=2545265 RepID=UPI0015DD8A5E|nr:CobW family GTP-binding protein [Streptomyces sp. AJS327]MBA0051986.1 GTP-binding protein [Streptomyces sp. AJS327]